MLIVSESELLVQRNDVGSNRLDLRNPNSGLAACFSDIEECWSALSLLGKQKCGLRFGA